MILPVRQYYTLYIIYVAVMLAIPVTFLSSCSGSRAGAPVEIRRLDLALRADIMPEDPAMQSAAATLFSLSGYGQLTDSAILPIQETANTMTVKYPGPGLKLEMSTLKRICTILIFPASNRNGGMNNG